MTHNKPRPAIQWRDLTQPRTQDTVLEIVRPLTLLLATILTCDIEFYSLSALSLFFLHIAALRSAHGAVHHTLGLSRWLDQIVLYSVSAILATSCHALELTHKLHHKKSGHKDDIEGHIANHGFWKACLISPTYHWQVIQAAWQLGNRKRRFSILLDLGLAALFQTLLLCFLSESVYLIWAGLILLNGASGLLSVWLFHRGGHLTRSGHLAIANWLAMGMLYHGEHHLYPGVPTSRLPTLAYRLKQINASPPPLLQTSANNSSVMVEN